MQLLENPNRGARIGLTRAGPYADGGAVSSPVLIGMGIGAAAYGGVREGYPDFNRSTSRPSRPRGTPSDHRRGSTGCVWARLASFACHTDLPFHETP